MKVLLINMPIRVNAAPNIVPTGVGILARMLEDAGHACDVLDLNIHRPEVTQDQVAGFLRDNEESYALVGMSGMITTLRWQKIVARLVRARWTDCCLVSGGGLASDFGAGLFDWVPELDVVVRGEGEGPLLKLINNIDPFKNSRAVLGPEIFCDLDRLPGVAWEKFDMKVYLGNAVWGIGASNSSWTPFAMKCSINLISSRGCPYNCNFCDRHTTGDRNYRLCSAGRLLRDVNEVIDGFKVDFIGFVDDNFISDKKRLREFLPLIADTGIRWGCHGRLNEVDETLAEALRASGCVYVGFGGESADPDVLRRMNKKNDPAGMSRAVKACQKAGITPNCTWIMGYPGETRESLRHTVRFIRDHGLSQKSMFVATAYPGTQFFTEVQDKILAVYGDLERYVLDLDDATKVLEHEGRLLNFSAMSDVDFQKCRSYIENGELERI